MQFYENGSLRDYLDSRLAVGDVLTWKERLKIAQDIAQGMAYIHDRRNGEVILMKNVRVGC